jgi:hypothetical protein
VTLVRAGPCPDVAIRVGAGVMSRQRPIGAEQAHVVVACVRMAGLASKGMHGHGWWMTANERALDRLVRARWRAIRPVAANDEAGPTRWIGERVALTRGAAQRGGHHWQVGLQQACGPGQQWLLPG